MTEPSKPQHKLPEYDPADSIVPRPSAEIDDALGTPQSVIDSRPVVSAESGEPPCKLCSGSGRIYEHVQDDTGIPCPKCTPVVSAESGEPPRALRKGYIPDHVTHEQAEAALAYWVNRAGIAESRIAELERALREIGNAVGAPVPAYYGAMFQREAFLETGRKISDLCAAALKEKQ